jgi:segregation and condensation protein B
MSDDPEQPHAIPSANPHVQEGSRPAGPAPEEGVPNELVPNELVPDELVPNELVPNQLVPNQLVPNELVPNELVPNELVPSELVPNERPPGEPVSRKLACEELASGERVPDGGGPEAPAPTSLREPDEDALRLAEALVFASAEPVTPRGLARVLPDDVDADAVLATLRARYAGRGVQLVDAGNGVMFRTAADLAPRLRQVIDAPRRLPRVAMETLAIVAYHQPMTRPEIEHIRGTALSQQTLDALLELNLIAPKGRRETPGRPTLWGTTPEFLAHFGLKDLRELPRREDLLLETAPPKTTPEVLPSDLQSPPP